MFYIINILYFRNVDSKIKLMTVSSECYKAITGYFIFCFLTGFFFPSAHPLSTSAMKLNK